MPSYFNDMKYHDLSLLEFSARRCTTLRDVCMYMFKFSKNNEELIRKALHHEEKMNEELKQIIDNKCAEIDNIMAKKQQLITELEAYKKSLIYEYVTGKKEVV